MTGKQKTTRRKRHWILMLGALLLGILAYVGFLIHRSSPDFYTEPRAALTSALQHLQRSYSEGKSAQEDLEIEHGEIEKTLRALDSAKVNEKGKIEIAALSARLRKLRQPNELARLTPDQLRKEYQEIQHGLQRLINENQ